MSRKKIDLQLLSIYLSELSDSSKIYIGCDSASYKRKGKWWADYYKVVVVHIDGCKGCRIFGEVDTEPDYFTNKKKPTYRLMNEVYKVSALYLELAQLTDKDIEVHLDINPDKAHSSSVIVDQAVGYIRGTCNVIPMVKPLAFAASYAADRLVRKGAV